MERLDKERTIEPPKPRIEKECDESVVLFILLFALLAVGEFLMGLIGR